MKSIKSISKNLKSLEKKNDTELFDEKNRINQEILKFNNFISEYDKNLKNLKRKYSKLKVLMKSFSECFEKNVEIKFNESGILFTKKNFDLNFKPLKAKEKFFNILDNLLKCANEVIALNSKFETDLNIQGGVFELVNTWGHGYPIYFYNSLFEQISFVLNTNDPHSRSQSESVFETNLKIHGKVISDINSEYRDFEKSIDAINFFKEFNKKLSKYFLGDSYICSVPAKSTIKKIIEIYEKRNRKIELIQRSRVKRKEKLENVGFVYVLSNKAYPNIYKIGSTYGLPQERAEELTGTGHLTPFITVYSIKIQNAEYYEKKIHKLLDKWRVKRGREFFDLELDKIKNCLKQVVVISDKGKKNIQYKTLKNKVKIK